MPLRVVKGELLLALVFVALGGLWIAKAAHMSLWDGFAPDSGFLPLVYGVLLAGLAAAACVRVVLGEATGAAEDLRKPLLVMGALIAAVAALPFAGFAVTIFALLVFLYAAVEKLPWLSSTVVSGSLTTALYLIFKTWLGVPLPSFFP